MRGTSFGSLWVPVVAIAALLTALAGLRPPLETLWGDEGTFVAMTASLARDGDLVFSEADRDWAEERVEGVGVTVILQRTQKGLTYSKPVAYALLGAPFFWLFGEVGMVGLNTMCLLFGVALAWGVLRARGERDLAAATLITFVGCCALLPYLLWRTSDLVQFGLTLGGLVLICGGGRRGTGRTPAPRALWVVTLGAVILGVAATMRLPNVALVAAAVAGCALVGRWRRAATVAVAATLAFALTTGAGALLTGSANPYKSERASFNSKIGYPVGEATESALERFAEVPATQSVTWRPAFDASRSLYSLLYFVLGRHTGLLIYFPIALLLLYRVARHPEPIGLALGGGVAAIAAFYLIWMPDNYFGGSTFVGNRYFLTSYAALLVAAPGLPSGRQLVPAWLIAAVVGISALYSVERTRALDPMSQNHAYNGVFRFLPYDTTAREIDGQTDRYWSGDFVRFVDPHAEVEPFEFTLDSTQSPAELVVATARAGSQPRLLITSPDEPLQLRVADWGRRRWLQLDRTEVGTRAEVILDLSRPWRNHRYWWSDETIYAVRTLRLTLLTPDGQPARAEVRYLGDGSVLSRSLQREVLRAEPPRTAATGSLSRIAISVRNTGDWPWSSEDVLPVYLSYRLRAPDGITIEGPRTAMVPPVEPGRVLTQELLVAWPDVPGRYRLTADLVVENVAWFEDQTGEPLVEAMVRVRKTAETEAAGE